MSTPMYTQSMSTFKIWLADTLQMNASRLRDREWWYWAGLVLVTMKWWEWLTGNSIMSIEWTAETLRTVVGS